jgi:hypothetical protein
MDDQHHTKRRREKSRSRGKNSRPSAWAWVAAVLFSLLPFAFALGIIITREFRLGRRARALITPENHPVVFWGVAALWTCGGLVIWALLFREWRAGRRARTEMHEAQAKA